MPFETSAGIVVYYKENNKVFYLLLHYPEGHWDLPKGHVENKESLKQTALRETKEETGLEVEIIDGFEESISYFHKFKGKNFHKTVHFFLGESKSKKVNLSNEHKGFKWLSFEEAIEKLTYENAKLVLKKSNQEITKI